MTDWTPVVERVARWSGSGEMGVSIASLSGATWEVEADRRFVAASTIKIPVMIALHRQFDAGRRTSLDRIALGPERTPGSGVLQHMHDGMELTLDDLCTLMIAISDNTATNLLTELVGFDEVNATIGDLGMTNSTMGRLMLGHRASQSTSENWVSASDLTTAVRAILGGTAAGAASCRRMKTMLTRQDQCRRITRYAPETAVWGSKPGSLAGIVNDAGFIETSRGAAVISVCTEGFARDHEAELACAEIAAAALSALDLLD